MKGRVTWQGDVAFLASSGSGHDIKIDGPPAYGGNNQGVRPMEMILLGLGGCSSFDVMEILKKSRQDVTGCVCELSAERADAIPAVFTKIHLSFEVSGNALKDSVVKRAVKLSAEKYCSASIMLEAGGVEISHDYKIIES